MTTSGTTHDVIAALRSRLTGEVVAAGDDEYEAARSVWNGMIDKRPVADRALPADRGRGGGRRRGARGRPADRRARRRPQRRRAGDGEGGVVIDLSRDERA